MMAYIVSKADLKVKDALTVISYEINEDTAAPAVTNIRFARMPSVNAGDYVCLKEAGETVYLGVVSGVEADKKTSVAALRSLPVSSVFSRNILLGDARAVTTDLSADMFASPASFSRGGEAAQLPAELRTPLARLHHPRPRLQPVPLRPPAVIPSPPVQVPPEPLPSPPGDRQPRGRQTRRVRRRPLATGEPAPGQGHGPRRTGPPARAFGRGARPRLVRRQPGPEGVQRPQAPAPPHAAQPAGPRPTVRATSSARRPAGPFSSCNTFPTVPQAPS